MQTPEQKRASYLRHRSAIRTRQSRYYALNSERIKARNRARSKATRARRKVTNALYRQTHPEVVRAVAQRHRARIKGAPRIEKIDRERIYARDNYRCHICGLYVRSGKRSLDHLIPLSFGGNHTEDNLALAHIICNARRGAGHLPAQLRLFG